MRQYFKQQIEGGATDNWFYGTEIDGTVRIERHRGTIDSLRLTGLEFDRMMGSTPFFRPCAYDEQGGEQGWAER
jgi:hypothetical protein